MRVELDGGEVIDLGVTETNPTIGITDYSRRETDAFGVTTVVPRSFSRRMSVRLGVPFDDADALQRRLADLRATPALWVAHDEIESLAIRGFYKDFSLDLAVPPLSLCTLTVEGLAETGAFDDPGGDPASEGQASTLQLLQPLVMTDAILTASSVAEDEYPAWAAGTTYPDGARVIAGHREFESLAAGNVGHVPAGSPDQWLDLGSTNRWAMFDQALGTATTAASEIALTLTPDADVTGLALLDVTQGIVRVQADGYDRTLGSEPGKTLTFLDLAVSAGEPITVTLSHGTFEEVLVWNDDAAWADTAAWADIATIGGGTGPVSVGTLLLGPVVALGVTEASPTAGITDYSRKETDDFGEVTVVERAWAKRMTANALIRSDAVDLVASRIEAVRAQPCLWIGDVGLESLTVYGFFKDFSIEVGETVSKLSLSIEGLSKAAPVVLPPETTVSWPNVTDPTGTKPDDNATNSADPSSPFGGGTVGGTIEQLNDAAAIAAAIKARTDTLEQTTIPAINQAAADASTRITTAQAAADQALANVVTEATRLDQRIDAVSASGGYDDTAVYAEVHRVDQAAIGRDLALGSSIDSVSASIGPSVNAKAQEITTAYTQADTALAGRAAALETTAGNHDARITATETAVSDGRFATAQRASNIEAAAGQLAARVSTTETATTDGRFAAASTVTQLRSEFDGTAATVSQQAGTIAGLGQRTAAYVRFITTAGNGRAQLTLSADANGGGGADLIGDLSVSGNLLVGGSVVTGALAANAVTQFASISGDSGFLGQASDVSQAVSLYATGGTVRVDVSFDYTASNGTNARYAVYLRRNGAALSRFININQINNTTNKAPLQFFVTESPGVGWQTYDLQFLQVSGSNGALSWSSVQIFAQEFKR